MGFTAGGDESPTPVLECHRFPPSQIVLNETDVTMLWPQVREDDWCGEWIRSFRYEGGEVLDHQTRFEEVGQINSFGVDSEGELYVMTYEGAVKKIVPVR